MPKAKKIIAEKKPIFGIFILDKSGSMETIVDDVIGGFNSYIDDLKKNIDAPYLLSMVQFDTVATEDTFTGLPLSEVPKLDHKNYNPRGGTPLIEAVIKTVEKFKNQVDKDQTALCIIMTDGQENSSSREYTNTRLFELTTALQNQGNWTFVFLGANIDNWSKVATRYGSYRGNVGGWQSTPLGTQAAFNNLSTSTRSFAAQSLSVPGAYSSSTFYTPEQQGLDEKDEQKDEKKEGFQYE